MGTTNVTSPPSSRGKRSDWNVARTQLTIGSGSVLPVLDTWVTQPSRPTTTRTLTRPASVGSVDRPRL